MKQSTYLSNFTVILPANKLSQTDLNTWIKNCHIKAEGLKPQSTYSENDLNTLSKLFDRYAVKETQIAYRYLETSDSSVDRNRFDLQLILF